MKKRSKEILDLLARRENNHTISTLAAKFEVSERTIRNDIKDINDYLKEQEITPIRFGSNGLIVMEEDISQAGETTQQEDLYTYKLLKEERRMLVAAILIDTKDHITLSQIADMLYVSRATIINDLDEVKKMLESGKLKVISHSNKGLRLEGLEGDKRLFLLRLMSVGSNGIKENSTIRSFLKGLNMEIKMSEDEQRNLQKIINEQEHAYGRFMTDDSFDYLLQYLMLSIERIRNGNAMIEPIEGNKSKYAMAKDIQKYICQYWDLEDAKGEVDFLCGVLDSMSYVKRQRREQKIIGLQLVTRKFIEHISKDLGVNLNKDFAFYENLTDHLESIIMRSFNVAQRDDFLKQYVEKNPKVLEVVLRYKDLLSNFMDREISDIEIDYIVIHICAALERRKKKEVEFRVLIVCGGGIGTSQLLLAKMRNRFDFHVVDVVSAHLLNNQKYQDIDLVISTIPLKDYEGEYILVTPIFSDEDYLRVSGKIEQIQEKHKIEPTPRSERVAVPQKNAQDLIDDLEEIIKDPALMNQVTRKVKEFFGIKIDIEEPLLCELLTVDNIQLDVECRNWQDAITKSAQPLLNQGKIEDKYIDAMIDNVKENGAYIVISPEFALPHEGFDRGCNEVGMNLIRLKEPVTIEDIDGEITKVRFFCCMSTEDHKKHMKAFFHLVNMLTNRGFKEELAAAKTSEEAADTIRKYEMRIK